MRFAGGLDALRAWRLPGLGPGASRAIGLGGIGSGIMAAGQLMNSEGSAAGNVGGAAGSLLGIPGAAAGTAIGAALGGGVLSPVTAPIGGFIGGWLGSELGGQAGRGLAETVTGVNQDPLLKAAKTQMEIERMRMPLQQDQLAMATQAERVRAQQMREIESARAREMAAMETVLQGQQNSAALQQQLIASILGGIG